MFVLYQYIKLVKCGTVHFELKWKILKGLGLNMSQRSQLGSFRIPVSNLFDVLFYVVTWRLFLLLIYTLLYMEPHTFQGY